MTDNKIGDEGAKAMSEMMKVNTTLTSLNLCGEGRGVKKTRKKRKSCLTGNGIGDEGAKSMSEMLKMNSTLKLLNLCGE